MVSSSLVFAITASGALSGWDTNAFSPCSHHIGRSRIISLQHDKITSRGNHRDVSLQMGFRSFIKRKILRRGEEDDDGTDDSDSQEVTLRTVLQSPNSSGLMESPVSSTYETQADPSSRNNKSTEDTLTNDMKQQLQEDAKSRIQRVQTGGMTEEEKMSFLNTALTRTLPPKKPRGPPIRQKIPGMENEDSNEEVVKKPSSTTGGRSSNNDNLWNAISKGSTGSVKPSGKSDYVPVSSLILDGKLKNEEAKKQWIDSITSPDRFASFSSIQREAALEEEESVDETVGLSETDEDVISTVDFVNETLNEDGVNEQVVPQSSLSDQDFTSMKRKMIEDQQMLLNKPQVKSGEKSVREALESILAMTNKNTTSSNTTETKNNDLAARLEKAAVEQETRDAENRATAEKKRMEEQRAMMEQQKQHQAKFLKQEAERMEEARKKAEKIRLDEEAKREAERARAEAAIAKQEEYWANQLKKQQAKREAAMSVEDRRKLEVQKRESEEMFERDVARDVRREQLREEERMREPKHEGEILKEAEQGKLRDRELTRDIIDESAAKVSRTAVKPPKGDASVSAFVQEQRKKKEEIDKLAEVQQQRLKMLNSPLTQQKTVGMSSPPPAPVVTTPSSAPRRAAERSSTSPALSLSSLTMKKNTQPPNASKNDSPKPVAKRPVKKTVRQQLPITQYDDDDEDDDNLMKKGGPGLTVADALKQRKKDGGDKPSGGKKMDANDRAKQWGIDMSKFQ